MFRCCVVGCSLVAHQDRVVKKRDKRFSSYSCSDTPGADPGINYEGQVGVHKSMNIITKGERGALEYSTLY